MDALRVALAKVRWSLHHRGVLGTLRTAATRLAPARPAPPQSIVHPFDEQFGVDTSGLVTAVNLLSGHAHDLLGTGYCGVAPSRFRRVLERWIASPPEQAVSNYSFIDIGCGKGRAMMLASAQPFAEIVGVELNPGLAQTAVDNIEKWRTANPSSPPMRALCRDATEFLFPAGPCLVYLYNPFAEPIFKLLLDHMERVFTVDPRPLDILYCNPRSIRVLDQHPSFQQVWSEAVPVAPEDVATNPSADSDETCYLYRRIIR